MALDLVKQARADEITGVLREVAIGKKTVTLAEHVALRDELAGIFAADAAPRPVVNERAAALASRADRLSRAVHDYEWSGPDRAILGKALFDTLQELPDGSYSPPAISSVGRPTRAMLPAGVTRQFADNALAGDAREAAAADLDTALAGLGAAPGAGDGGAAQ